MASIRITARLIAKGERAFGPGKADLLERIAAEGSISKAAKSMEMSYSRAWQLVDAMNHSFRQPLVESSAGGRKGGGEGHGRADKMTTVHASSLAGVGPSVNDRACARDLPLVPEPGKLAS